LTVLRFKNEKEGGRLPYSKPAALTIAADALEVEADLGR
jgi:hypothetical protein